MMYSIQYESEAHWITIAHCEGLTYAERVYMACSYVFSYQYWRIVETESRKVIKSTMK